MLSTDGPSKVALPFAAGGGRSTIPTASQIGIVAGAASLNDGFPPLTRTPKIAGGIPPSGLEMNGILYLLSAGLRWQQAGGEAQFDSTFATAIGGYPAGAILQSTDKTGFWRSMADNNSTDPDAGGANWVPHFASGAASQALASVNVTLTAVQSLKPQIVLTGTLTADINLIFPSNVQQWLVTNSTTGAFRITAKTASGSGVVLGSGPNMIYGDATNILTALPPSGGYTGSTPAVIAVGSAGAAIGTIGVSGWERRPDGKGRQWVTMQCYDDAGTTVNTWTFPNASLFATGISALRNSNLAYLAGQTPVGGATPANMQISLVGQSATGITFKCHGMGSPGYSWLYIEVEGY